VSVAVFGAVGGYATSEQFSEGFSGSMTAVAILAFVGMLIGLGMPKRRPAAPAGPAAPAAPAAPAQAAAPVPQTEKA
jgi:hypothetical protein